jgi:hypothetical protein
MTYLFSFSLNAGTGKCEVRCSFNFLNLLFLMGTTDITEFEIR